jgi:hypothetical protein
MSNIAYDNVGTENSELKAADFFALTSHTVKYRFNSRVLRTQFSEL